MSLPKDVGDKKVSRRRVLQSAGALLAAGVIGAGLTGPAIDLLKEGKAAASPTKVSSIASRETPATRPMTPMVRTTPILPNTGGGKTFSIFWITDTQFLSEANPLLFQAQVNWIVNNWNAYNGKLVVHTGDLVEDGYVQAEWKNANTAMSTLTQNGIPYVWCAGNHDDYSNGDPTSGWKGNVWAPAFDPTIVSSYVNSLRYSSWVGDYHEGMNTAIAFTANGLNFLVVCLEWNAEPDALAWLESILDNPGYANYHIIVAPHAYMDYAGLTNDTKWGATMANFVDTLTPMLDNHPNIFLTLNGHFATDCGYYTPEPIGTRNQLMFDRQDSLDQCDSPEGQGVDDTESQPSVPDSAKVGGSTVMVLTFDTGNNEIRARTWDIFRGEWRNDPVEQYAVSMFPIPAGTPNYIPQAKSQNVVPSIIS